MNEKSRTYLTQYKCYRASSEGNAAIEFSIVLPVLLLFFLGTIDFGLVIFEKVNLRSAVNAGIAYAMGVAQTPSLVQAKIQNATTMNNLTVNVTQVCKCSDNSDIDCSGTCPGATSPDQYLQINATTAVSLTGLYNFVENPYTLTENALVMVR